MRAVGDRRVTDQGKVQASLRERPEYQPTVREVAIRETFCIKIPSAIAGTNPSTKAPGTISGTTAPCPIDVVPEIVPAMSLEMVIVPEIVPGLLMEKLFVPGIAPEAKCMDAVVPEIVPKVPCKGTPLCPEPCAGFAIHLLNSMRL